MTKDLAHYLALPYQFVVTRQENDDGPYWEGRVLEVPTISGVGATAAEAADSVSTSLEIWIEDALESGASIPEPARVEGYSGQFRLRVPKVVHRDLATRADTEGVSLNTWCLSVLTQHGT